jgi:hypothetical protein
MVFTLDRQEERLKGGMEMSEYQERQKGTNRFCLKEDIESPGFRKV